LKAKAISPFYDAQGILMKEADVLLKKGYKISYPLKAYLDCNVNYYFKNLKELQAFLATCSYVSDSDQYKIEDYWSTPNDFESKKKGDCEDFALYTWRQLLHMEYDARFVLGNVGKDKGHAWCTAVIKGKNYIIEPLQSKLPFLPIFFFEKYKPAISVSYEDNKLAYHQHRSLTERGKKIYHLFLIPREIVFVLALALFIVVAIIPGVLFKSGKRIIARYRARYVI